MVAVGHDILRRRLHIVNGVAHSERQPRVAQHRAVVFRVADGDRRADRDVQTPAQRLQAAALVDAGGIDLHARALTRDDPCGRTLHAREELGALGRVRKVKVKLLDRVRRGKEAALHLLGSRAVGLEIIHIGVHAETLRVVEQLRPIEGLAVGKDDRKAVKPDKRAHNARRRIGSDVLRRDDAVFHTVSHGRTAGRDGIAHGREPAHIRRDLPVAAPGRHDDMVSARKRLRHGGGRARRDLFF